MKLEKIRCTHIKKAMNCEISLKYELTMPQPDKKSVYLIIGTVFHAVIEQYLKNKVNGYLMTLTDRVKYFNQEWEKNRGNADFSKMSEDMARKSCLDYVQMYHNERLRYLNPLNEQCIEISIKIKAIGQGRSILITGKADLIDKSMFLIDHKTSSREKKQEDYDNDPQAFIYPLGLIAQGYDIKGTQFSIAGKKKCQAFTVPYDKNKTNEILNYCLRLQESMENEDSLLRAKNIYVCRMCEWKEICTEKLI